MAELATVAEYQVVRLPDGVTDEQGALIEPTAVAAYGVERAGVGPAISVLVTGAGPIGALAALCAAAAGAGAVYISETESRRAARGPSASASARSSTRRRSMCPRMLREQTDGLGVDVAIECSGPSVTPSTRASTLVRRRGTLAQTGLYVGEASVEPMLWALNDLTIVGTWCYWVYDFDRGSPRRSPPADLPVERVVTAALTSDQAPSAVRAARAGRGRRDEGPGLT